MAGSRALATRCPACGTVFRVVPDQLRVSDGWVRCGRCAEVFNAPETLVDMDTGARQRRPDPGPDHAVQAAPTADGRDAAPPVDRPAFGAGESMPPATPADEPVQPPSAGEDLPAPAGRTDTAATPALDFGAAMPASGPADDPDKLPDPRAEPDDRPPPSFVRRAEQAARWRRPRVRLALGAAAGLAALVLVAQVVFSYRDLAAARWPALHPVLAQACARLGCALAAPRLVAGLAVQSSGLSRVEASNLYRLSVTLRNRADIEVAPPAIDLSLTDAQGRLVARRVLGLAEFGQPQDRLAAGGELVLQATLQVGAPQADPVAGYTIELFYP